MHSMHKEGHARPRRLAGIGLLVTLGVVAMFAALSGSSVAAPQVAPVNTQEPSITGAARVGNVLQGDRGNWTGAESYAYRWMRCDPDGSAPNASDCAPINNATGTNYRLRGSDRGFRIRFRVTATNDDGSTVAASNQTAVVQQPNQSGAPENTSRPAITGTPSPGSRLEASRGSWTGDQPITYGYRWIRCDSQGNACSDISGRDGEHLRRPERRSRPDASGPRHRPERSRHPKRDVRADRGRLADAHPAAEWQLDPRRSAAGGWRSPRRRPGAVLAEPGDEPYRADHRPRPHHGA